MIQVSIGFSTSQGWISKVIRWFTKSKFSHAFLIIRDEPMLGPCVFQSDSGGIQIITLDTFDTQRNPILKEYVPQIDLFPAIKQCANLLKEEYDYAGLFGMVWVEFWWQFFKWRVRNPLHNSNQFYCSGFITKLMQTANWSASSSLDVGATDAQMLADFIDSHPS